MNNQEYEVYLKSQEWREKCEQRRAIDGGRCVVCGCKGTPNNELEVHHISYRAIGHEDVFTDLVTLCRNCHKNAHLLMNRVTSPNGRHGWKDGRYPNISAFIDGGVVSYRVLPD